MIQVDILKAKAIAHAKRRAARATELAPLDVQVTIPTMAEQAEAKRAEIRAKYADLQTRINKADSTEVLLDLITNL